MVAGGGASVIYADTIVDMGGVKELANYGKALRLWRNHTFTRKFLLNLLNIQIYFSFILNNPLILSSVGEYSGGPNEQQTYAYAKTVLDLMCKHPHEDGKILIIGGGIANFTNVADTFKVRWKI